MHCSAGLAACLREASLLSMPRPRALLLDFYGTLVHEDTEVVDYICQEVSRNVPAATPAEVARTWSPRSDFPGSARTKWSTSATR